MGQDKGNARKALAQQKFNKETLRRVENKANKINKAILGPVGNQVMRSGIDVAKSAGRGMMASQKASRKVFDQARNADKAFGQFGTNVAKNVIKDTQGVAKMIIKGFGF